MHRLFAALIVGLLCLAPSTAQQLYVQQIGGVQSQSLQMWGGGEVVHQEWTLTTGIHWAMPDGSGFFLLGSDNVWHRQDTSVGFAQANCDQPNFNNGGSGSGSCFGIYPKTGTSQAYMNTAAGAIELCGAPTDSKRAYVYYTESNPAGGQFAWIMRADNVDPTNPDAVIWKNVNQLGNTSAWSPTNDGANQANRQSGRYIACDPNNEHHVLVGTYGEGVWETTDDGNHFTRLDPADLPTAGSAVNYVMAFDPNSGTNGSGLTNTFCVATDSNGGANPGVYCTTNGSMASLTLTTSSPTPLQNLRFGASGLLWGVSGATLSASGALSKVTVTGSAPWTWAASNIGVTNLHWITIDPVNPTHMVVATNTGGLYSTSATTPDTGWSGLQNFTFPIKPGDSAWLASLATNKGPNIYNIEFDPLGSGNVEAALGQGTTTSTFSAISSGTYQWTEHNKGVSHAIGWSMAVASPQTVITGAQDVQGMTFTAAASSLPSPLGQPVAWTKSLTFGSGTAVATNDRTFALQKISPDFAGTTDYSGFSRDNFVNTSIPFNSWYAIAPGSNITNSGGNVQISLVGTNYTTSGLTQFTTGTNGSSGSIVCTIPIPSPTTALAIVANTVMGRSPDCFTVASVSSSTVFTINATFSSNQQIAGNYIVYVPSLTSNRQQITNVVNCADNGSGLLRLTIVDNRATIVTTRSAIFVQGIQGATQCNGWWPVSATSSSARTVDLGGSSSVGVGTYTQGGTVGIYVQGGGSVAAWDSQNFAVAPANFDFPKCTTNGGATFTDVNPAWLTSSANVATTVTGGPYTGGATSFTVADITKIPAVTAQMWVVMDDGRLLEVLVGSKVGSTVTIQSTASYIGAIPTGRTISAGANIYTGFGWNRADFLAATTVAYDYINPSTSYYVNTLGGLFKQVNCAPPGGGTIGDATQVNNLSSAPGAGKWQGLGGNNVTLLAVPRNAGHLFYTAGQQGSTTGIATTNLWRTCNGNNSTAASGVTQGVNFVALDGIFGPIAVGFGAPKPGSAGYPSIYFQGWYDNQDPPGSKSEANAVFGIWESTDDPNQGNSGTSVSCNSACTLGANNTCTGVCAVTNCALAYSANGGSFQQVGGGTVPGFMSALPGGPQWPSLAHMISGDPFGPYGLVYVQTSDGPYMFTVN